MDPLQLHLLGNHVPVIGVLFAALTLGVGLARRAQGLRRFGIVCVLGVALTTVPVYFSGEPAEERLERSVAIPEAILERHEDAARVSLIAAMALGAWALALLWRSRKRAVTGMETALLLIATIAAAGTVAWTAHLGGQIRHSEVRSAVTANEAASGEPGSAAGAAEDRDD